MRILTARLLISWAVLLGLGLVLTLGLGVQGADYPTPFAISQTYGLLAGLELFFILVVVPLLARAEGRWASLAELVLLLAMAAPVVVVGAWVSDSDVASVAASQGYLLAAAAFMAGYLRLDAEGRLRGWYWLALGVLGAGAPLVAFVAGDLFHMPFRWLFALSPFWVVAQASAAWPPSIECLAACGGMVLVAAGSLACSGRST